MQWFSDLKIKFKLGLGFSSVLAILLIFAVLTYFENKTVETAARDAAHAYETTVKLRAVQMELLDMSSLTRGIVITANDYLMGIFDKTSTAFDLDIEDLITLYEDDPEGQAIALELKSTIVGLRDNVLVKQITLMKDPASHEVAVKMEVEGEGWPFLEKVLKTVDQATVRQREILDAKNAAMNEAFQRQTLLIAISAGLAVILSVIVMLIIARGIDNPIGRMTRAMLELADRNLEITIPHTKRKDEIGDMGRAVGVFRDNMIRNDEMVAEQEVQQKRQLENADHLKRLTGEFENSVANVLSAVDDAGGQMSNSADEMSGIATMTQEKSTIVVSAANEASVNVETVAAATEELLASIQEISSQASKSADVASNATTIATDTQVTVGELAKSADRIGEVVSLITEIAEQTNLLALNATIEAARAGDAGKGFAVVANEVKGLAAQTARATEEISSQIGGIQTTTDKAVKAMESISSIIQEITQTVGGIAAAVEEQTAATQEISQNVAQASVGTSQVTESMGDVNEACNRTGETAEQVKGAVVELTRKTQSLNEEVRVFLAEVQKAS